MIPVFIGSAIVFLLAVAGMALGVTLAGKPIKGSCGGLSCASCRTCPRRKQKP